MSKILTPLQLIIVATAGWLNHQQADVVDYLIEQVRVQLEGEFRAPSVASQVLRLAGFLRRMNKWTSREFVHADTGLFLLR